MVHNDESREMTVIAKVGIELLVNSCMASDQKNPTITGLSNGDFAVAEY
jgi:hypothetical protein